MMAEQTRRPSHNSGRIKNGPIHTTAGKGNWPDRNKSRKRLAGPVETTNERTGRSSKNDEQIGITDDVRTTALRYWSAKSKGRQRETKDTLEMTPGKNERPRENKTRKRLRSQVAMTAERD